MTTKEPTIISKIARRRRSVGRMLLVVPFVMVAFTAAIVYVPPPRELPPNAEEKLRELKVSADIGSAIDAASVDDLLVLDLLRNVGVDLSLAGPDGSTPLSHAALNGAREAAAYLIRTAPTSIHTPDAAGLTPLALAVTAAKPDLVELLVAAGADPHAKGSWERPLLVVAATRMHAETVHALLECGASDGIDRALVTAVKTGDILITKHLLGSGADPSVETEPGLPLLHYAASVSEPRLIKLLADAGASLSAPDASGRTALGVAIDSAQRENTAQLMACGADLDAPSHGARTPLELALEGRSEKLAAYLLELGAVPHPSLVFAAYEQQQFAFLELLVAHGAILDAPGADGDSLLARELQSGKETNIDSLRRLLQLGCDPNQRAKEGQSLLAVAIGRRATEAVNTLIEFGADVNARLAYPASEAFRELVDSRTLSYYLARDSRFTPLMIAAGVGEPDTIRVLLEHGASKGHYTRNWKRYPISFASEAKHIEAQQLLVGYDPQKREDQYKVVISLSKQRATLFRNDEAINSSRVSTGKKGYRTPTGEYVITHKHRHHTSNLYDAQMPYFMRLSCGAFGTHTGYVPGYPASHGCIRMPNTKARAFFNTCPHGTPVSIVD